MKIELKNGFELIHGDCLEVMRGTPDNLIDLTVTSPPYDNLRSYNDSLDWGPHVWEPAIKNLYRLSRPGGVLVWIVNDATIGGSETGTSFRQALHAMECGFNLHDTMIWEKSGPPKNHNRYEPWFEYMFVFSKGAPRTWNPIKRKKLYMDKRNKKNMGRNADGSLINGFANSGLEDTIIPNIWKVPNIVSTDKTGGHPAPFPGDIAKRHIISWSNPGDIVLDCFAGSGTTGEACHLTGRRFIGIEKDAEYFQIAKKRIEQAQQQPLLFGDINES